ncbi:MAG: hypothetical protein MZV70_13420 [Desulfobacterales bacterium]|nr:hypothetical protein [Desulfobacterales bacterium]
MRALSCRDASSSRQSRPRRRSRSRPLRRLSRQRPPAARTAASASGTGRTGSARSSGAWTAAGTARQGQHRSDGADSHPDGGKAQHAAGNELTWRSKDYDNAIKEFTVAIQKYPAYDVAYSNRAVAYMQQKKFNKAWTISRRPRKSTPGTRRSITTSSPSTLSRTSSTAPSIRSTAALNWASTTMTLSASIPI